MKVLILLRQLQLYILRSLTMSKLEQHNNRKGTIVSPHFTNYDPVKESFFVSNTSIHPGACAMQMDGFAICTAA